MFLGLKAFTVSDIRLRDPRLQELYYSRILCLLGQHRILCVVYMLMQVRVIAMVR